MKQYPQHFWNYTDTDKIVKRASRAHDWVTEKDCLTILNNNFKCMCGEQRTHFPKIIDCDMSKLEFTLTHCGDTVGFLCSAAPCQPVPRLAAPWPMLAVPFLKDVMLAVEQHKIIKQVECIIHNLKINEITHLDVSICNVCINKDGDFSLIDFGLATTTPHVHWPVMIKNLKLIGGVLTPNF